MSHRGLILVCDDDADRVKRWAESIAMVDEVNSRYVVEPLPPHRFAEAFRGLRSRKAAARGQAHTMTVQGADEEAAQLVDSADILVVDYDLTPDANRVRDPVDDDGTLTELTGKSGEDFVYLARCFSRARVAIVVNQGVQRKVFDLTLQRYADSFADVNVTSHDLNLPTLWLGTGGGFRPWSWPRLLDLPSLVERRWRLVQDLDQNVLSALGLEDEMHLGAFTQAQLDPLGDDPQDATFRWLARESGRGLNAKDSGAQLVDDNLRPIAAAVTARWLEWHVLPGQNVLIDAPHLVQRYPGALTGEPLDVETWDQTADLADGGNGIDTSVLSSAEVPAGQWTTRRVWSLPRLVERGASLFRASSTDGPTYVFCEDISRFADLDSAIEMEAAVLSPYFQRFIRMLDGYDYSPRTRLQG